VNSVTHEPTTKAIQAGAANAGPRWADRRRGRGGRRAQAVLGCAAL